MKAVNIGFPYIICGSDLSMRNSELGNTDFGLLSGCDAAAAVH